MDSTDFNQTATLMLEVLKAQPGLLTVKAANAAAGADVGDFLIALHGKLDSLLKPKAP